MSDATATATPARKSSRRSYYKKRPRRRRYSRNTTKINRMGSGFPPSVLVPHTYVDSYKLSTTGSPAIAATQQFRMNSLYDPDYTNTGHQPYYFDQTAAMYSQYHVYACLVEIWAGTPTTGSSILVAIQPSISPSTPSDAQLGLERPNARCLVVDAGGATQYFKKFYRMSNVFGVSQREILEDDTFGANNSGNPTNPAYLNISAIGLDTTVEVVLNINVKLTLYAKWQKRIDQSES